MLESLQAPVSNIASPPHRQVLDDVHASVQIEAEVRRVLQALAMPEYMEAWLQLPGADRIECHADRRSFDRFRIDMICSGGRKESISGSCLLSKPNKITYLWERDPAAGLARSVVELRLWGNPGGCAVKLRHTGLRNEAEKEWHRQMWTSSLQKLSALMEGTASGFADSLSHD